MCVHEAVNVLLLMPPSEERTNLTKQFRDSWIDLVKTITCDLFNSFSVLNHWVVTEGTWSVIMRNVACAVVIHFISLLVRNYSLHFVLVVNAPSPIHGHTPMLHIVKIVQFSSGPHSNVTYWKDWCSNEIIELTFPLASGNQITSLLLQNFPAILHSRYGAMCHDR